MLPDHLRSLIDRGWNVVYVSDEPTLYGVMYTVTFENRAGTRTARHVRENNAAILRALTS
jgi:hypothetical protein